MVYSFFIGIVIFLLLIGSLAILIGKKQDWLELSEKRDLGTSRRSRYKETNIADGLAFQSISTVDDHQLFRKAADKPKNVEMETSDETFNLDDYDSHKEVAVTSEMNDLNDNHRSDDFINEEIHTFDTIQLETYETEQYEQKETEVSEELSDLWMQKRVNSLFENTEKTSSVKTDANNELLNMETDSFRYEDLSESYFKEVRSEENGKS